MTLGVVLAGGASSRFGGAPKGLQVFRGRAMVLTVADVLAEVAGRVLIEASREAGYEELGLPVIHAVPAHAGRGPLAGIVAGLAAAPEGSRVVFAPCDMPLIGAEVFRTLLRERGSAYAVSPDGAQPLVAVLARDALVTLRDALALDIVPRTDVSLESAGAHSVRFDDAAPFANVNTPEDLARLAEP
jgi:molybdopterin-guanine dinucleotide biosynthesis protein A